MNHRIVLSIATALSTFIMATPASAQESRQGGRTGLVMTFESASARRLFLADAGTAARKPIAGLTAAAVGPGEVSGERQWGRRRPGDPSRARCIIGKVAVGTIAGFLYGTLLDGWGEMQGRIVASTTVAGAGIGIAVGAIGCRQP